MNSRRFRADEVAVALGDRFDIEWDDAVITARAVISFGGSQGRFVTCFVTEDSPVPAPYFSPEENTGGVFLPFHEFDGFLTLVRADRDLFVHLDGDRPERSRVSTALDPLANLTPPLKPNTGAGLQPKSEVES